MALEHHPQQVFVQQLLHALEDLFELEWEPPLEVSWQLNLARRVEVLGILLEPILSERILSSCHQAVVCSFDKSSETHKLLAEQVIQELLERLVLQTRISHRTIVVCDVVVRHLLRCKSDLRRSLGLPQPFNIAVSLGYLLLCVYFIRSHVALHQSRKRL